MTAYRDMSREELLELKSRLEKEFDMDDRWQKIINDRNANFIPDDLEDPESLDSFKD